jgi:Fur family ferric uptake transcriptional regulator
VASERGFTLQEHSLALYARCSKEVCPHKQK